MEPQPPPHASPAADPRRWVTLAILLTSVLIVGLDTSVLNVAIPTLLREFDTTLPDLQWVITGYSLVFAAFLIIGGRLADIYGARQTFIVGAVLFGIGSLIAALSTGVLMLAIGEAVIEGLGAAIMMPSSMAILTTTFRGRERATAFSLWTATIGAAFALGPVLGGFLTTNFTWRWAFVINVIVVPFAITGVLLLTRREPRTGVREPIDVPGALLIASGMGLLVFGISGGERYGWWRPMERLVIGGTTIVPDDGPLSVVPLAFVLAFVLLYAFYRLERAKEARNAWPLFEFSQLRHRGFRYGLCTLLFLAMGQVTMILVLTVFLQNAKHLSAMDTGLWIVPGGLSIIVGSQVGARLTRVVGTVAVVRIGLGILTGGLAWMSAVIHPTVPFPTVLPGLVIFGFGIGFGASQLTNVILRDIPVESSGAASGANNTVRMIGAALGVATVSALLSGFTVAYAVDNLRDARNLDPGVRAQAVALVRENGVNSRAIRVESARSTAVVQASIADAIGSAARQALRFGTIVAGLGFLLSFLIPTTRAPVTEAERERELEAELMAEATTIQ